MSRPSPLSFARKKALQRKRTVAPLRCRGLIDAFLEKSFAKPLWKKFHWGFSFAKKKAWQRKRIVAHASLGVLDRRFFGKKLCKKLRGVTPAGFFFLMPSVVCSTLGCEAVAAERAVRMRMNFASKTMRAKPMRQMSRG